MKPMLAAPSDGKDLNYPLLCSPKLDGVRCLIINGVAVSRNLKPIRNVYVQSIISQSKLDGLDGELIVGDETSKTVYNDTVSGVMSKDGEPSFMFRVFDDFSCRGNFSARLARVSDRCVRLPRALLPNIKYVHHDIVLDEAQLSLLEQTYLSQGYEGLMIRHPQGPYKKGRSTLKEGYLLKVKRFTDAEAIVIGCHQYLQNNNESEVNELGHKEKSSKKEGKVALQLLGALKVRDLVSGIEFDIGTGFDLSQRRELWASRIDLIGKMVKYKSQLIGVKDKPRFPVFLGFRSIDDM